MISVRNTYRLAEFSGGIRNNSAWTTQEAYFYTLEAGPIILGSFGLGFVWACVEYWMLVYISPCRVAIVAPTTGRLFGSISGFMPHCNPAGPSIMQHRTRWLVCIYQFPFFLVIDPTLAYMCCTIRITFANGLM